MSEFNENCQVMEMLNCVKSYVGPRPIIIEAGAHNGSDTTRMANFFDNPLIFAFEPMPDQYELLCKKAKSYINIFTEQVALAAEEKPYLFHISAGSSDASSSLLRPKDHLSIHPDVKFENVIEVSGINIDQWCNKNSLKHIDFMWLDMQGGEYSALSASPHMLSQTKALYTEVSLIETYEGVVLYPEYKSFLESFGFRVVLEHLNWTDMGNVLFLRQ